MPIEEELAFADQIGRHFARYYGLPPMTGRVLGWLLICDPPQQTAAELSEALQASRSAVSNAITALENWGYVLRSRPAGERVDRIRLNPTAWAESFEVPGESAALAALFAVGLEVLADETPARRARLLEAKAFSDFIAERLPRFRDEWRAHREVLRAKGELPDDCD